MQTGMGVIVGEGSRKCVVFLYQDREGGERERKPVGTAFLIGVEGAGRMVGPNLQPGI